MDLSYVRQEVKTWLSNKDKTKFLIEFISLDSWEMEKRPNAWIFRYTHEKYVDFFLFLNEIYALYNQDIDIVGNWYYNSTDNEKFNEIALLYMCGVISIDFSESDFMHVEWYAHVQLSRDGDKETFLQKINSGYRALFSEAWVLYGYEDKDNSQMEHEVMPDTFDTDGCDLSDANVYNCQKCNRKYASILDWICDIRNHPGVLDVFANLARTDTIKVIQKYISLMKCLCGLEYDVHSMNKLINTDDDDLSYEYSNSPPYSELVYAYVCGVLYFNLTDPEVIRINTRGDQNWSEMLIFLGKLGDKRKLFFSASIQMNPEIQPHGVPDIDPSFLQGHATAGVMDTSDSGLPFIPDASEVDFGGLAMVIGDPMPIEKCPGIMRDHIHRCAKTYISKVFEIYNVDIPKNRDLFGILKLDPCVGHFRLKVDQRINLYMDLIYISVIIVDDLIIDDYRTIIIKDLFYNLAAHRNILVLPEEKKLKFLAQLYISGLINLHYSGTTLIATRKDIKLDQFNRKPHPIFNKQIGELAPLFELAWRTYEGGCTSKLIL